MTTPTVPQEIQTSNAALIVTFYGPHQTASEKRLESVTVHLATSLDLQATSSPDHWQDLTPDHETFLHRFDPAAATDTTILQLALNEPGNASIAWDVLRYKLEAVFDESIFKTLWGYSLTYQAETIEPKPDIPILELVALLLPIARRPGMPASEAAGAQPLAKTNLTDGTIWLIDVPKQDGLAAATVYMALNNPDTGNQLVARHLYGPAARLLMPDLIAHKGYFQARQYQLGGFREKYSQQLNAIHATTHLQLHQLVVHKDRMTRLETLARDYGYLVDTLTHLERLRVALARQLHNYAWWQRNNNGDDILEYHRTFLETSSAEIQLLIDEGKGALDAAGTAVEMVQARLDSERQRQQEVLNTILAIVAVALALPQILDREVVHAILIGLGFQKGAGSPAILWLFGVQALVILFIMIAASLLVHFISNRKEKSKKR